MKTALVTGASGGIGRAIAEKLASQGYTVAVHCNRGIDRAQALAKALSGIAVQADLADASQIEAMAQTVTDAFGHVDVLVNNAGISVTGLLTDIDAAARRELFGVNVLGAIECARALLPGMIRRQAGWSTRSRSGTD